LPEAELSRIAHELFRQAAPGANRDGVAQGLTPGANPLRLFISRVAPTPRTTASAVR
jgi:hypothetical protein